MFDSLTLAFPWCAGLALMLVGLVSLLARGRVSVDKPARAVRLSIDDRLAELGFRGGKGRWEGRSGGRPIRWMILDDPQARPPTVQEISTPLAGIGELAVSIGDAEQSGNDGSNRNKLGDASFDQWFDVAGSLEELALLDAPVRRALCNAARDTRPQIAQGTLVLIGPGDGDVDARLAPLVAVAGALEQAASVPLAVRVAKIVKSDPDPRVRVRFLEWLADRVDGADLADLAQIASEDPDPAVRTQAAVLLADPERLLAIAQSDQASYRDRRKAGRTLLQRGTDHQRVEAAVALAHGPEKVHPIALELAMTASSAGLGVDPVLQALTASPNPEVARQAAALLRGGTRSAAPAARAERRSTPPVRPGLQASFDDRSPAEGDDRTLLRIPPVQGPGSLPGPRKKG